MKEENELNDDLKQLLDTLEEHGRNTRRQAQLSDLIDSLEASGTSLRGGTTKQSRQEATSQSVASTSDKTSSLDCFVPRNDVKRRKLIPLWWAMGVAAACLLLWLLIKPTVKQTPEPNEKTLVEETKNVVPTDSTEKEPKENVPAQEPLQFKEPIAESKPLKAERLFTKKPAKVKQPEKTENVVLADIEDVESIELETIESEVAKTETSSEPLATQSSKTTRRVIQSTNLVSFKKLDKKGKPIPKRPILEDKTIFGQPQDANMKNGMLAYEIKF